jgi:hypothetical protein
LARSGALLVSFGGRAALLVALRALVWLGAVTSVWLALALTRWSFRMRGVVGALAMLAAPIDQALELGNLSSATAGLTIAALFALEQSAVTAVVLLTLAILLKPLPAIVPCLLVAQGLALSRVERGTLPKPLMAGAATALTCGALFALTGGLGAWQQFYAGAENNIAVVRVVRAFGLMAPPSLVTAAAALGGAGLAVRHAREPRLVAGLALWLDFTTLACILATSDALGAVFFQSPRLNALFVLIPLATPSLLLAYARRQSVTVAS